MIELEPKPEDPETVAAEKICAEMREIAKKLPKPEGTKKYEGLKQFGNNFYLLFLALERDKKITAPPSKKDLVNIKIYLRKIEMLHGEQWAKFLKENAGLIERIEEVSRQREVASQLVDRLSTLDQNPRTRKLGGGIFEEINLEGIQREIWDKLNPLLKQASETMVKYGIKPEDFYG
ncbi:MAG TPA: hypothetical protein VJC14_01890 [Candidatus Paceibacterota bacterium]